MQPSSCPVCDLIFPFVDLERHVNSHFEEGDDEELARDMELAQQLALAPSIPPPVSNYEVNREVPCEEMLQKIPESSTSRSDEWTMRSGNWKVDEKISSLKDLQIRGVFYKVEGGILALLRKRLELEFGNSTSILSGYVDHFQGIASEDIGWGCGWRNIQMLSSHLLMQRKEAREVLFGGSGFVPDIQSLQRWLEIAWERGFDPMGSAHFNNKIYGSKKWIGTTECAALLRSFGIRARVVDFGPKELESLYLSVPGSSLGADVMETGYKGKRKAVQFYGPMDKFLLHKTDNVLQEGSGGCEKVIHSHIQSGGAVGVKANDNLADKITRKAGGYQVLIDWVWNYFSDNSVIKRGDNRVFVTDKAPLYFQHDGHSRTIIGIQMKHQKNGSQQYNLLILDPAHRTAAMERSLKENAGWQKHTKRGVHTLKKPQYQLCYIDEGIANGEEMEQLKIIDSIFLEI